MENFSRKEHGSANERDLQETPLCFCNTNREGCSGEFERIRGAVVPTDWIGMRLGDWALKIALAFRRRGFEASGYDESRRDGRMV